MDLSNIFKTDRDGIRKGLVKNLISMALADGQLKKDEWDFLLTICKELGMSEEEVIFISENPDQVKFIPPKKYDEKVQHVQDLVAIMTIDGEINGKELELCKRISLRLDLLPQLVDEIISKTIHSAGTDDH